MPNRHASATDAAAIIVRTDTAATAQWADLAELLLALGYTVVPTVWYYTLGEHGEVVGLDAAQRGRTGFNLRTFYCHSWPGTTRPTEHSISDNANRFGSDLYNDFSDGLSVALSGSGHGLVGAVTVAKKFPGSPGDIGGYYCSPIEYTVPHPEGMTVFSNHFWRVSPGSMVTSPVGKTMFVPDSLGGATDKAVMVGLWYWLEKQKFKSVFKVWVRGTSAAKPRKTPERTIEHTGTCQVCIKNQKLNAAGKLVLHGYHRPGYGYIVGNCPGMNELPFEVSCDVCRSMRDRLTEARASAKKAISRFEQDVKDGSLKTLKHPDAGRTYSKIPSDAVVTPADNTYNPMIGSTLWEDAIKVRRRHLASSLRDIDSLLQDMERLIAIWEPRPLPDQPGYVDVSTLLLRYNKDQRSKDRNAAVLSTKLEGDSFFPFAPCTDCDPIYNQLQQQVKESGIFDIPSFSATAYRVGPVDPKLRGIFFSADYRGAKAYRSGHEGHDIKKYSINVGRTVVAGHQSRLIELFFKKSMQDLHYECSRKVNSDSIGWARVDAKIMREAKRRGYAAIIYTRPAHPAAVEIVVFSDRGVHEVENDEASNSQSEERHASSMQRNAYLYSARAKKYLYHVTPSRNLPRIVRYGIQPRESEVQDDKAVYLTEVAGLPMWWSWVSGKAGYNTKDGWKRDHLVVLRTPAVDRETQLRLDELGTYDAKYDATHDLDKYFNKRYLIKQRSSSNVERQRRYEKMIFDLESKAKAYKHAHPVRPNELQIWTGTRWVQLSSWQQVKLPYNVHDLFSSLANKAVYDPKTLRKVAELSDEGFVGKRWGSQGAGLLLTTGKRVLLLKRSPYVEEPNTWGYPGGAVRRDPRTGEYDDLKKAAIREAEEEVGSLPPYRLKTETFVYSEPSFKYTTFVGVVSEAAAKRWALPTSFDWESTAAGWFDADQLGDLDLHFGFAGLLAKRPDLVFFGKR